MNYDILVVGGGIGGMESALKLGDMGYKVLLVEKEASVGGKMILLSKVFPTLDCSSCISTPKMAATSHHPNVNLMVYSEVDQIKKNSDGTFSATVRQKPTFVDPNLCTGCRQCETGCNVAVPDQFNSDMVSRRAAYIAFPQAVPKKAVIERQGTSPCSYTCPTGIKAHGYVALARTGKYDEAFDLILESTPLVGSLGRACYAPCQDQCTRKDIDGAVSIRRIKRFVADRYYSSHPETVYKLDHKDNKDHNAGFKACPSIPMAAALEVAATKDIPSDSGVLQLAGNPGAPQGLDPSGPSAANYQQYLTSGYETGAYKKVAVVGSGPAGLTCAMHLARQGYQVKIFEAQAQPGGMLTLALPDFRLPRAVVERDIKNVTGLGVEIQTGIKIQNPLELKEQGFDAVFLATGTHGTGKMGIEGENLEGVVTSLDFLRQANLGLVREGSTKESSLEANTSGGSSSFENSSKNSSIKESNSFTDKPLQKSSPLNLTLIKDKTVLVVGGGNVAIDSARVAVRLGAGRVIVQYRRGRQEMPAHEWEIEAAEKEGIEFQYLCAPVKFKGRGGRLATVESLRMELGEADHKGRRSPVPVKGSEFETAADLVITAVGLVPDTGDFAGALKLNGNRTISVDQDTLQTGTPYIFAGGDAVSGPSMIVSAAGQGRRAAFYIDRYLRGEDLKAGEFDYKLPMMDREQVLKRQQSYRILPPVESTEKVHAGVRDFAETEGPFDPEEALYSAGRCLDCGVCSQCQQCVDICPADAINMSMKEEVTQIKAGAVIVSTGFKLFPADAKPQYGYGRYKNVITGMQMDRLLAPTRPYNSVLRPGDGKVPDSIAYILCTGSRDQTVGNPLCSRVCCMYSIKQNQLIMGALPLADVTVYYIDIRAFSKGYEEFYQQAKGMGANFVKGKVAKIEETENGNLTLLYEDIENGGEVKTAEHDMVVLSVGILPNTEVFSLFSGVELAQDEYFYVQEVDEDINPGKTSIEGVFVAGTASGARDIPDVILHAGACAAQAAAYVERTRVMS